ncbi:RagB/SusD family nutrient uptake outer membrane protein [Bacteroides gallinarum]|uniref:RagB/SusD family nutrient uptake outer membrane protein n=1 Tax=Bacteroides gallinarum TaxID=376806 RepID=UPI00035C9AB3|nr:RagB/SusD family nutrient uptake outer membrane protein [Bacteroides gallinarum]
MKKLIYLTAIAGSLLLTTSCVDLTQEPESFITEEDYWSAIDQQSLQKAADALYNDLWQGNYGFNSRLQRLNVCADDITYRAAKANNELAYYGRLTPNLTANDADFSTTWTLFYKVISSSNKIIKGTTIPTDEEEAKAFKEILGEAYFMRGLSYFYLVRLYGDVPLLLEDDEAIITMPRTAVSEIYDKAIVPSLKTAAEWLPNQGRSGNSTPSKWAAKACLADVYMTMAGWPLNKGTEYYGLAAAEAQDIIDNANGAGLSLTTKYSDLWKEANKSQTNEVMFALQHSSKHKLASNYGKSYYPSDYAPNAGWADYYGDEDFFLAYPDDARKEHNYMTKWKVKSGDVIPYTQSADKLPAISKYYDYDEGDPGKSAQANGITCIYRYAEVLLMYAEASTRATNTVNAAALDAIKKVQIRAGYQDKGLSLTTTTDPTEFLKDVSNERGWEFFAEMKRWFELVRLEKVKDVRAEEWDASLFNTNHHYYFPVPYQQIDLAGWTNNAGY